MSALATVDRGPMLNHKHYPLSLFRGEPRYNASGEAAAKLILGEVDACVTVAGYPEVNVSRLMAIGHPNGKMISADSALDGIGIPMHRGLIVIIARSAGLNSVYNLQWVASIPVIAFR